MSERPGRCPVCGGPLVNTPSGSCCIAMACPSRLQRTLPTGVQLANAMELEGNPVPVAVHWGIATSCAPNWYTRRIYTVGDKKGHFRRTARSSSPEEAAENGRLWALFDERMIELGPYTPADGDKPTAKLDDAAKAAGGE